MAEGLILQDKRVERRRELIYYLQVLDVATGAELGRMVDIHSGGLLIMGPPLPLESVYDLAIQLPKTFQERGRTEVRLKGKVKWQKPAQNRQFMQNGIMFLEPTSMELNLIERLIELCAMPGDSSAG